MHFCCWSARAGRLATQGAPAVFLVIWKKKMLYKLFDIVEERKNNPVEGSYTNQLLAASCEKAAQKVGEEAVEVILAATSQGRQRVIEEASDLVYHLFVLLVQQGITLSEVEKELEKRHAQKGSR
jgi:phosphoribosyl-ATP pyrophosphohydrolase